MLPDITRKFLCGLYVYFNFCEISDAILNNVMKGYLNSLMIKRKEIVLHWFLVVPIPFVAKAKWWPSLCYVEDILPKGPYRPSVSMAARALLAGYHRCVRYRTRRLLRVENCLITTDSSWIFSILCNPGIFFTEGSMSSSTKSCKICNSHIQSNGQIKAQLCTYHDSWAVVTCLKSCESRLRHKEFSQYFNYERINTLWSDPHCTTIVAFSELLTCNANNCVHNRIIQTSFASILL